MRARRVHMTDCWNPVMDAVSSGSQEKRASANYQATLKKPASVEVWPCLSAHSTSVTAMLKGVYRFRNETCRHPDDIVFRGVPVDLSKTMRSHILCGWQQTGLNTIQTCLLLRCAAPNQPKKIQAVCYITCKKGKKWQSFPNRVCVLGRGGWVSTPPSQLQMWCAEGIPVCV